MATQLTRPSRIKRVPSGASRAGDSIASRSFEQLNPINKVSNVKNAAHNVFKKKITLNLILIVCFSLICDILEIILTFFDAGVSISFFAELILAVWFHFTGIKFTSAKVAIMGLTPVVDMIPFAGFIPLITAGALYSYYSD
jgi:hypothetical protein